MKDKYNFNYMSDTKYCYPNSSILINKLNIQNDFELYDAERNIVSYELAGLYLEPVNGNFDFNHLKEIHERLFHRLYDWAGEERTISISKGDLFCLPQYINKFADDIFIELKRNNYLLYYDNDETIIKLADIFADINALHPFREGNGRTLRVFIESLSKINGIDLNISIISCKEMLIANQRSLNGNNDLLYEMFQINSKPLSKEEQIKFINLYCSDQLLNYLERKNQSNKHLR